MTAAGEDLLKVGVGQIILKIIMSLVPTSSSLPAAVLVLVQAEGSFTGVEDDIRIEGTGSGRNAASHVITMGIMDRSSKICRRGTLIIIH
jgi:hypothetical protein